MQVQLPPPAEGARFRVPTKPPVLVTVIVELCEDPAGIVRDEGRAERLKPPTNAVTFTLWPSPVPAETVMVKMPELAVVVVIVKLDRAMLQ